MTGLHPPVLVHGNPETAAIWAPLQEALGREVVCLSPPGFGAPLPSGFPATMDSYRDWLTDELAGIGRPVDLVGHDWGGAHVLNVVLARPDLVRTWASDTVGLFDPDYVWHGLAQGWQTPGVGEADVTQRFGADLATRTAAMLERGFPGPVAAQVAAGQDADMGRAVLALYRSAAQPAMASAGRHLHQAARRPGLAIIATGDHLVGSLDQRVRSAARADARTALLTDLGHWWMLEDPQRGAQELQRFWDRPGHR